MSTKRVLGIGGVFFKSNNPAALIEWYNTHLGFNAADYGAVFEFNKPGEKPESGSMVWCPFKEDTTYFAPSDKPFMINFRVADLNSLVPILKEEGVTVLDEIADSEYGKFAHIMDPDGNKLELWEPPVEQNQ